MDKTLRNTAPVLFFAALLVAMWALTRVELVPGPNLKVVSPSAVSGDEPHYLMVVNSILFDHDLELQDDYERVRRGGLGAGRRWRGGLPDHHTIVVNLRTGAHALWWNIPGRFAAAAASGRAGQYRATGSELMPSPDVYEVSAHPVAFPALLAAAIAPFHPPIEEVERDAGLAMVMISWLGVLFTWMLARRAGMEPGAGLLAAAVLALASPWLAYTRSYHSEPVIGLSLVIALWAIEAERPVLAAFATAAAFILKPPFAVVGAGFVLERLLVPFQPVPFQPVRSSSRSWQRPLEVGTGRVGADCRGKVCQPASGGVLSFSVKVVGTALAAGRRREGWLMALVMGLCGLALGGFNYWLARTPLIAGVLGWRTAHDLRALYEMLVGARKGLLVFAPWTIFAFFGIGNALGSAENRSTLVARMALPVMLYFVLLAAYDEPQGACYGPRYWVPFLPWLALGSIERVNAASRFERIVFGILVSIAAAIAIPAALRYPEMFSQPVLAAWRGLR